MCSCTVQRVHSIQLNIGAQTLMQTITNHPEPVSQCQAVRVIKIRPTAVIALILYIHLGSRFFIQSIWTSLQRQTRSNLLHSSCQVDKAGIFLYAFINPIDAHLKCISVGFWLLVSPDSYHIGVTVQRVAIQEGVIDPVFGENGQPAADDSAAERGDGIRCDPAASLAPLFRYQKTLLAHV